MQPENDMSTRLAALATVLLPLSIFALAVAITYFTYQLSEVVEEIPDILHTIDNTTEKVAPVVDDVNQMVILIPDILSEVEAVRKTVPPILDEVAAVRQTIPPVLTEVEQTRKQIPAILDESKAIRGELPAVLATADRASASVNEVSTQVEASLPRVDRTLDEVVITRESVPGTLDRVEGLIDKARVAGREASQGAVTGFFSGIFMAPFALVADAGRSIAGLSVEEAKEYTAEDLELNKQAALYLLNGGEVKEQKQWSNDNSGHYGVVTLEREYQGGEYAEIDCRTLSFTFYENDELQTDAERSFCKNDAGEWTFDD